MNNIDRLNELKAMSKMPSGILSSDYAFNEWHGRVSGLLGFDVIARHKFEGLCDFILREHEFGNGFINEDVIQAENKMLAIVARAISDLEINKCDSLQSVPAEIRKPEPTSFQPTKMSANPPSQNVINYHAAPELTNSEGPLWFWHHCHYTVKWKLVVMACAATVTLLGVGWLANEQEVLRDIARAFQKIQKPPTKAPDSNTDPKAVPPKP